MANAKPKDIELPKFSDKEREEKKPAAPKETKEVKKVKTPEPESVVEEKKPEAPQAEQKEEKVEKPVEMKDEKKKAAPEVVPAPVEEKGKKGKNKDPLNSNIFIPNQPVLGAWRFFFPYFLRFIYFAVLLVCCVAIFALPTIKLDPAITVKFPGADAPIAFADAVSQLKDSNALYGTIYGITHAIVPVEGVFSIVDVVFVNMADILAGNIDAMGIIGVAGGLWCVVLFAIILVIEIIWFLIKFISSLIGLIFFWAKKHKKIDNFYYKNTKGFYTLGLLNWDFTFVVALILNGLIFAGMNVDLKSLIGITLFDSIFNTEIMNQGNMTLMVCFGVLLLVRLLYRLSVILVSKKVKKTYVRKLNYRALKKAAKKGEEIH